MQGGRHNAIRQPAADRKYAKAVSERPYRIVRPLCIDHQRRRRVRVGLVVRRVCDSVHRERLKTPGKTDHRMKTEENNIIRKRKKSTRQGMLLIPCCSYLKRLH